MKIDTTVVRDILQDLRRRYLKKEISNISYTEQLTLLVACSLNKMAF